MEWESIVKSPSKSFFVVVLGFLVGIFVGALIDQPMYQWPFFFIFLLMIAGSILAGQNKKWRLIALMLAFFVLGLFRFSQGFFPPDAPLVSEAVNQEIRVEGIISDEVTEKTEAQQVTIDQVRVAGDPLVGKVMVWLPKYPEASYGDEIAFRCQLEKPEPFDGFAYDKYLRSRGVLAVCWRPEAVDIRETEQPGLRAGLFSVKRSVLDKTEEIFAEPHSTFLAGLLFGGKGSLASDLRQDFVDTGTAHILAASGYNVSIFSRYIFLFLVAFFFRRKAALGIVAGLIGFYVVMSGLDPAVTRAGVMGLIVLFGRGIGRTGSVRNILALTAAVMLTANPYLLLDDVGFQLSFLATIGLVSLVPRIEPWFKFIPTSGGFREAIVSTVAATGMSLPILILQFGVISTVSVLVNLLVLPLVPYAMGFGALAIAVGFVSVNLAAIISAAAWTCLSVMLFVIRFFGSLSWASIAIPVHQFVSIIAAVGVIGFLFLLYRRRPEYLPSSNELRKPVLAGCAMSMLFVGSMWFGHHDSAGSNLNLDHKLRVWFLDVGQGDAIFIETPEGEQILVDGGPGEAVLPKLGAVMPFWDRSIDTIVLTHPHMDHLSGLIEVLDRYQVDRVVLTGVKYRSFYLEAFEERIRLEGSKIVYVDQPMNIVDGTVQIDAIYPHDSFTNQNVDDINETSIVLAINYQQTSILLTGDMYVAQEPEVASQIHESVDVLKVPHQGSRTSSSVGFLRELDPDTAIITVGENSYGHPHPIVVSRLQDQGSDIYRTDHDGDVLVTSDGGEPVVKAKPLIF